MQCMCCSPGPIVIAAAFSTCIQNVFQTEHVLRDCLFAFLSFLFFFLTIIENSFCLARPFFCNSTSFLQLHFSEDWGFECSTHSVSQI